METSPNTSGGMEIAEYFSHEELTAQIPQLETLITEDNAPVDNLFSAKQQRLFVERLQ